MNRANALPGDRERGPSASHAARRREDVLQDIKLALVASELTLEEPRRGFDPYNAKLGSSPRDVWSRVARYR